jgi:hypothetical protein
MRAEAETEGLRLGRFVSFGDAVSPDRTPGPPPHEMTAEDGGRPHPVLDGGVLPRVLRVLRADTRTGPAEIPAKGRKN